ncbi:MAG TPA: sulfite exporter TauE/SafE family protein [Flavobacterium sp.]|jgi:hypothetical protein
MDNFYVLILIGLLIGTIGTLIGAGGGFILVPLLIIFHPELSPESITAISMAVVACNSVSGSAAYVAAKRIDYKAGIIFALFTIPGSILGVMTTDVIPRQTFDVIFGIILLALAIFLFARGGKKNTVPKEIQTKKGWTVKHLVDKQGNEYNYAYDVRKGSILSLFVGYFSPIFGIGGGIIHVPAMTEWLRFPVHIATATSQFILAVMATVSVGVHFYNGTYDDSKLTIMIFALAIGVIPGAQIGAYFSRKIKGRMIVQILAVALGIIGIRILIS